jgi:hypothetical protein
VQRQVLLGAFVLHCLDKFGPARYREIHFADLATTKTPLGDLLEIEAEWRAKLKEKKIGEDELARARASLGLDVLGDPSKWRDLTPKLREGRFKTEGAGRWKASAEGLEWSGERGAADQSARAHFPEDASAARLAVRASVRLSDLSRARLTARDRDGRASSALLAPSGAQLVTIENTVAGKSAQRLDDGRWYDVVLALENGGGRLYLDGELVAEAKEGLVRGPGKVAIECEGKRVEVRSAAVRGLE